jgi:hypothetical protein
VSQTGILAGDDHGVKQPVEQSSADDRMAEEITHSAKPRFEVRITAPSRRLFSRWLEH